MTTSFSEAYINALIKKHLEKALKEAVQELKELKNERNIIQRTESR